MDGLSSMPTRDDGVPKSVGDRSRADRRDMNSSRWMTGAVLLMCRLQPGVPTNDLELR
jgi:hypothetical protein